jgi:hypothetical protein
LAGRDAPKELSSADVSSGMMYRGSLDGLAEKVRALEEERGRLEVDLAGMRRIRWPQRALRLGVALLALLAATVFGGAIGYRHGADRAMDIFGRRLDNAHERIYECRGQLATLLSAPPEPLPARTGASSVGDYGDPLAAE